jgi:hypothetical protein
LQQQGDAFEGRPAPAAVPHSGRSVILEVYVIAHDDLLPLPPLHLACGSDTRASSRHGSMHVVQIRLADETELQKRIIEAVGQGVRRELTDLDARLQ